MNLRPCEIYFTQDSIGSTFGRCTDHSETKIGETLDRLVSGNCSISSIPKIHVMKENGKWWTADNRRLWIFRHLEKLGKCSTIPVNIVYKINSIKRTTKNGGTDVSLRRNPGGMSWRRVDSIEIPDRVQENKVCDIQKITDKIQENKTSDALKQNNGNTGSKKASPFVTYNSNVLKSVDDNECSIIQTKNKAILPADLKETKNSMPVPWVDFPRYTIDLSLLASLSGKTLEIDTAKYVNRSKGKRNIRNSTSIERLSESSVKFPHVQIRKKRKGILKNTLKFKANISGNYETNLVKISHQCFFTKRVRFNLMMQSLFNCNSFTSRIVYPKEELPSDSYDMEDIEDDSIFAIDPSEYLDSPESFDCISPDEWETPDNNKIIVKSNPFDNWVESDSSNDEWDSDNSDDYDYRDYDLTSRKETLSCVENDYLSDEETSSDYYHLALLDKIYKEDQWDSDTDNMYYEYVD